MVKADAPKQILDMIDKVTPLKTKRKSLILHSETITKANLTEMLKGRTLNFELVLLPNGQGWY